MAIYNYVLSSSILDVELQIQLYNSNVLQLRPFDIWTIRY